MKILFLGGNRYFGKGVLNLLSKNKKNKYKILEIANDSVKFKDFYKLIGANNQHLIERAKYPFLIIT